MVTNGFHNPADVKAGFLEARFPGGVGSDVFGCQGVAMSMPDVRVFPKR